MKKDIESYMEKAGIDAIIMSGAPAKNKDIFYMTGFSKITGGIVIKKRGEEPLLLHGHMEVDEAAKTGLVSAFRSIQAPVEFLLGAGGVNLGVNPGIVGFLVDDQALRAGFHHFPVVLSFHRTNLEGDSGNLGSQRGNAFRHVIV